MPRSRSCFSAASSRLAAAPWRRASGADGKPDSADHATASRSASAAWSAIRAARTRIPSREFTRPSWQIARGRPRRPGHGSSARGARGDQHPPALRGPVDHRPPGLVLGHRHRDPRGDLDSGAHRPEPTAASTATAEPPCRSPAEFAEPFVVDAEVVRDLVDDGAAHLVGDLILGAADRADLAAVDDDPVGQDPGVLGGPAGQRDALVEAEQAARARAVLDGDRDVAHHRAKLLRQSIQRRGYHLFEAFRLDHNHVPIVQRRGRYNRGAGAGVLTVTRLAEPAQSEGIVMQSTLLLARRALPAAALTCTAVLATGCGSTSSTTASGNAPPAPSASSAPAPAPASPVPAATPAQSAPPGPGPCPTRSLQVKLGVGQGTAGSIYIPIDFTNISNVTCTLYGYPGVSLQTAKPVQQIGKPARENPATPRQLVTLQPQTTGNALLRIVDAGNYPASMCGPVTAHYLQVYPPNQTTPAYIKYK